MATSNYLENKLVDHVLRNTAYTSPTTVYVALFTDDPTDADTGTEVATASYDRQSVTFSAPSNGATSNSAEVAWDTATESWGTITHIGVYDALTTGNLLYHGPLSESLEVLTDNVFKIAVGDLDATLS